VSIDQLRGIITVLNAPFTERDSIEIAGLRRNIASLQPGFLMLQDWDAEGQDVPGSSIAEWFQRIDRFRWLKFEVRNAGPKYTRVLQATDGRLRLAGGWAVTEMLDGLRRGMHAFMPTATRGIYGTDRVRVAGSAWTVALESEADRLARIIRDQCRP